MGNFHSLTTWIWQILILAEWASKNYGNAIIISFLPVESERDLQDVVTNTITNSSLNNLAYKPGGMNA